MSQQLCQVSGQVVFALCSEPEGEKEEICQMLLRVTVIFFCRYVNGKTYMEDVADALEQAKEEIFITDWW